MSKKNKAPNMSFVDRFKNNVLFGAQEKIDICDSIASLLRDGLTIKEISEDFVKYGSSNQKRVGQSMLKQMQSGQPVSNGLAPYFGHLAMQAVQTSEKSKRLAEGFEQAKNTLRTTSGIGMRLLKMWFISLLQLTIMLILFVNMGNSAWPSLSKMVPAARWPVLATELKGLSDWLGTNYFSTLIMLVLIIIGFNLILRRLTGPVRDLCDQFPLFKQYRLGVASNVLFTMAMMLKTGASLKESIERCEKGATQYQLWKIRLIKKRFIDSRSSNLGDMLNVQLLDNRQLNRLILLSKGSRGTVNSMRLERSAEYHQQQLENVITKVGELMSLIFKFTGTLLIVLLVISIQLLASSMT